jgi:hypothetical protein
MRDTHGLAICEDSDFAEIPACCSADDRSGLAQREAAVRRSQVVPHLFSAGPNAPICRL